MRNKIWFGLALVGSFCATSTVRAQSTYEVPPPPSAVAYRGPSNNDAPRQTTSTRFASQSASNDVNQVQYMTQDSMPPLPRQAPSNSADVYPSNTIPQNYAPPTRQPSIFVNDPQLPQREPVMYQPVETRQTPMERCIEARNRFYINYESLTLRPRTRNQNFAVVDNNLDNVLDGRIESVDFDTDAGYRLGLGMNFSSGWYGEFYYTYFHSSNNRTIGAPANGSIFPTLTRPGVIAEVLTASASTGIDYDVFDFSLGRNLEMGENGLLRISAGPRFAFIDQSLVARYNGIDADRASVHTPTSFEGAGIRVGGEGQWLIGRGWRLYGSAFGSLVTGEMTTRIVERDGNGAIPITLVTEKFDTVVPVVELGLGIGWQGRHLNFRIGYEMANWFNLIDTPDFADDVNQGKLLRRHSDLSLDGLVFRLGWTF